MLPWNEEKKNRQLIPHSLMTRKHNYSICSDKGFTLKRQHMIGQGKESWTKRGLIGCTKLTCHVTYNTPSYKVAMIQRSSHSKGRPCPLPLVYNVLVSWASLLSCVPIPPSHPFLMSGLAGDIFPVISDSRHANAADLNQPIRISVGGVRLPLILKRKLWSSKLILTYHHHHTEGYNGRL